MADIRTSSGTTYDHVGLTDTFASRRYFRKFDGIMQHMLRVAGVMEAEGALSKDEVAILARYATMLSYTFKALSLKYLLVGRNTGRFFGSLTIDKRESGFPVTEEIMTMANDAQQAASHLAGTASVEALKDQMVRTILGDRQIPTKLQFALSQRLYYEELQKGQLFWVRNDPQAEWLGNDAQGRNLPVLYLMELEDSGQTALPKDQYRWPEVQAHLSAQALGGLKLVTIARGFDEDFADLHPKRLRRFHLGPMYSHAYTKQKGPLREVLAEANAPEGQDWALVWTEEELRSDRVVEEKSGWFSTVEREIFALDPFGAQGADLGATRSQRSIILPQRPYQVLEEKNPIGFGDVRKFVVSPSGRVLRY